MIIVDIYVPSVDRAFDFMIDENEKVSAVMEDVTEMIALKTGSRSPDAGPRFVLYKSDNEQPLSAFLSLSENGVRDGDRLILV